MLPVHELALLLPDMTAEQRIELKRDIRANGLIDPITTYQGKVLDGRHRDALCGELGVAPKYTKYTGKDPAAFVIAKNLHRRHLTKPQRDTLGAKILGYWDAEMKRRQRAGGAAGGRAAGSLRPNGSKLPRGETATQKAAKLVGSSARNVGRARRVQKARPDLFEKVQAGKMTVSEAETEVAADKAKAKRAGANATTKAAKPKPRLQSVPTQTRRAKNWNGKTNSAREDEVRKQHKDTLAEIRRNARRFQSDYSKLVTLQLAIDKLCLTLEDLSLVPIEYNDAATLLVARDIHDDLITMGIWQDRQLGRFQAFASDTKVRATIAKLRAMTVANGCPAPEAANAQKAADQLQQKLDNKLAA